MASPRDPDEAWSDLVAAGRLPARWLDDPRRRFVVVQRERCPSCGGAWVRGNETCWNCEQGYLYYDELELARPKSAHLCTWVANNRARLVRAESLGRKAAARMAPKGVPPRAILWRIEHHLDAVQIPPGLFELAKELMRAFGPPPDELADGSAFDTYRCWVAWLEEARDDAARRGLPVPERAAALPHVRALMDANVWLIDTTSRVVLATSLITPK